MDFFPNSNETTNSMAFANYLKNYTGEASRYLTAGNYKGSTAFTDGSTWTSFATWLNKVCCLRNSAASLIIKMVLEGWRIAFGASRKRKVRTPSGVMLRNSGFDRRYTRAES